MSDSKRDLEKELQGIPGTGNAFEGSGILITRIEDGKITADWEENDQLGMMWQLGMELKPREGK
jgi:predicted ester cyclase